jgi:parallel beta-helix repeat protein
VKRFLLAAIALALSSSAAFAQNGRYDSVAFSSSGRFAPGVNVAVCTTLTTTAASVSGNIATLTFASNPVTAGFVAGFTLTSSGFTGADTYFNGSFVISATSSTTISFPLTYANASATSNGSVYMTGSSTQACAALATISTDSTGSTSSPNPFTADSLGNDGLWAAPGQYKVQLYGPTVTTSIFNVSIACVPLNSTSCGVLLGSNKLWTGSQSLPPVSNLDGYLLVDGTTYPKTAVGINAALGACTAAGGGSVLLPPGKINITALLTWSGNPCNFEGSGRGGTVLQMVDPTNDINAIVPSSGSRIAHMTLKGTGVAGNANGITGALSSVTIDDCDISGFGGYGINSGVGSVDWVVRGNFLHNNLNAGILYGQSTNGVIQGNQIYSNTKNGIDIGGSSFITIDGNSIFSNGGSGVPAIDQDGINDFSSTTTGVSSHNVIIGNDVHDNNTHGIRLQAGAGGQILYEVVVGNNVHNNGNGNGVTKGGADIILRNDGGSGQMVGNTVTGNTTSGAIGTGAGGCNGDGICLLSSGGAGAFNTVTVSGNTSTGNGNYGLELINSNIVDTTVSGNNLINNTTGPFTDTSARSVWGCNHTQTTTGACEFNGSFTINGSTSGFAIQAVPAVAGRPTFTYPTVSGTNEIVIGSGSTALGTGALGTAGCETTITVAVKGVTTNSRITWQYATDPSGVAGYGSAPIDAIHIQAWPTSGNVNFKQCSSVAVTPGAISILWNAFN